MSSINCLPALSATEEKWLAVLIVCGSTGRRKDGRRCNHRDENQGNEKVVQAFPLSGAHKKGYPRGVPLGNQPKRLWIPLVMLLCYMSAFGVQ